MSEREEHIKEAFTQASDALVVQEFGIIMLIAWQLEPFEQIEKSLSIFLDSKPDTNKNQIVIISTCFGLCHSFSLVNWMSSTIDCHGIVSTILSLQPIVGQQIGTDSACLEAGFDELVEELPPILELTWAQSLTVKLEARK